MKFTHTRMTMLLSILALPMTAQAVPVTFGSMSSNDDGSTDVITDSLNNRDWLRLDQLAHLTYAQTLTAIGAGGTHEGYQIATIADANLFVEALFGPGNVCADSAVNFSALCGTGSDWHALLGHDFSPSSEVAWFLSNNAGGQDVGYLQALEPQPDANFYKFNDWSSISQSDRYSDNGDQSNMISWLLFTGHNSAAAPEPSILVLLGLGLAGLGFTHRKRTA